MHNLLTIIAAAVEGPTVAIGEARPNSASPLPFFSPNLPIVFFTPPTLPTLAFCAVPLSLLNTG
jgi:hypothetical protein